MNHRERFHAVMNYESYDRLPVTCFSFLSETLEKWAVEGHLTQEEIKGSLDGNEIELNIIKKLGFDYNLYTTLSTEKNLGTLLYPEFEEKVLEVLPDGKQKMLNYYGIIELHIPNGVQTIHAEIDTLFKGRKSW